MKVLSPNLWLLLFSHPVVSDSLQPHGLQPPYPSGFPVPLWEFAQVHVHCRPAISSSDALFFFCPQSFPASGTFPMNHLFTSNDQNTGASASASASILPMNIQDRFPLGLIGWISLQSKGLSRVFFNTTVQKHQFFGAQPSSQSNSHIHT